MNTKIRQTIDLVNAVEDNYGSIYKAPFYCEEFKKIRMMFPEKKPRGDTYYWHSNMESIKYDYEHGKAIYRIQSKYHVRGSAIRRYSSMYGWKRNK